MDAMVCVTATQKPTDKTRKKLTSCPISAGNFVGIAIRIKWRGKYVRNHFLIVCYIEELVLLVLNLSFATLSYQMFSY